MVKGQVHHFAARGLYNGGLVLGDRETSSFWHHLTGTCLHGPLKGQQIDVFPLVHASAGQALTAHPEAQVALAGPSLQRLLVVRVQEVILGLLGGRLPPGFRRTMGTEDTRRPRMERGLAVWTASARRFYPREALRARGGALIDRLDGQRVLVYLDPMSGEPACLTTDATQPSWHGDTLVLDTGECLRGAFLYGRQGTPQVTYRPMQSVVCWYTFAFAFPNGDIYGI
jgi:hypothetical protein